MKGSDQQICIKSRKEKESFLRTKERGFDDATN